MHDLEVEFPALTCVTHRDIHLDTVGKVLLAVLTGPFQLIVVSSGPIYTSLTPWPPMSMMSFVIAVQTLISFVTEAQLFLTLMTYK